MNMSTRREKIVKLLKSSSMTLQEISSYFDVPYSTIPEDINSIRKTLRRQGLRIFVAPAECIKCGFVFRDRSRVDDPKKCPKCHDERIDPQRFRIE